jgi:hypothetical protein
MIDRRTFLIKSALFSILGNSFLNKSHSKTNNYLNDYTAIQKRIMKGKNKISFNWNGHLG